MKRHIVGWAFLSPSHTEKWYEDSFPCGLLKDFAPSPSEVRQGVHLCPEAPRVLGLELRMNAVFITYGNAAWGAGCSRLTRD